MLATAPALAQSKRYPPEPKDADREAEQRSAFWDSAIDPAKKPYDDLVVEGKRRVDERTRDAAKLALLALDQAVHLLPKEPRAYVLRGEAHLALEEWAACADDLAFADAHATPGLSQERERQMLELGVCQARANKLADAEHTLAHLVSVSPHGDPWMRLGETRIALGKLDEAIDALEAALATQDAQRGLAEWLLALAYDRARRPTEADEHALMAIKYDVQFNMLVNAQYPFLHAGEKEYLLALAYRAGSVPTPEYALLYFRQFMKLAPDSPWRRRADEHLRELAAMPMPQTLQPGGGNVAVDLAVVRPPIEKAMQAMRACAAKRGAVWQVEIVRAGPRTPESTRDRPRYTIPAEGASAKSMLAIDDDRDDLAVQKCLVGVASKLSLPPPKERDSYYRVRFLVAPP